MNHVAKKNSLQDISYMHCIAPVKIVYILMLCSQYVCVNLDGLLTMLISKVGHYTY